MVAGERLQKQLNYWQQQLAGAPEVIQLPTDRIHPQEPSFRGAHYRQHVSSETVIQLRQLAHQQGVTLFMLLLSIFKILLHRYSGQDDILVGLPMSHRHPQTEELIGFFVNTIVLRSHCENNPTFIEFLQQIRTITLEALEYPDVPFDQLLQHLQIPRHTSRHP